MRLWLIRFYALIIILVTLLNFLEGGAFKLVISIAAIAIVVQSFFLIRK